MKQKGFTLIELLIVIVVIMVIAAISIPNLMRSRMAANQASAVASVRLVNVAEVAYSTTYGQGYSATLLYLGPSATPGATPTSTTAILIDSVLASGAKSGYTIVYSAGAPDSTGKVQNYTVVATPMNAWAGANSYYTDQSGVIRQNAYTTATSTDPPIGAPVG